MQQLKKIDMQAGTFTANGKNYLIEQALTIERYCEFQILEKELGYGITFKGLFDKLNTLYGYINKSRFADSAVLLNDIIRGMGKLEEREPTVLKMCALFINTEDEDRTKFSQDMYTQKIADWKAEGLDIKDFFLLASSSVNGFTETYQRVTRIISGLEQIGDLNQ